MTKPALREFLERAAIDYAFRAQFRSEPLAVLARYDLGDDEKDALRTGDHRGRRPDGSSGGFPL